MRVAELALNRGIRILEWARRMVAGPSARGSDRARRRTGEMVCTARRSLSKRAGIRDAWDGDWVGGGEVMEMAPGIRGAGVISGSLLGISGHCLFVSFEARGDSAQ